jgi:ribosome recycling factor
MSVMGHENTHSVSQILENIDFMSTEFDTSMSNVTLLTTILVDIYLHRVPLTEVSLSSTLHIVDIKKVTKQHAIA